MSDVEAETLLSSAPSLPRAVFIRLCWRLLPILWLGYVLNIVDRTNLGYAALQMTDDLHLSQRAFGLASGIFFCAYAALQIPSNHALPTVGATRILSACMIGWGACSAATSLVGGETSLLALRFALGLAEAGFYPGVLYYLARWFPEAVSSEALALFSTAASVGSFVSSAGSGALMTAMDGVGGVRGWRWLLLLQGLPSVLLGLLAPLALTDSPERAAWLERGECAALLAALRRGDEAAAPDAAPPPPPPLGIALRATCVRPTSWAFALQYVGVSSVTNIGRFFLPTLLKGVFPYWTPRKIGLLFAIPAALNVALAPPLASWADRDRDRRRRAAWGLCGGAAAMLLVAGATLVAAGSALGVGGAAATVGLVSAAVLAAQCAIPLFWSQHNAVTPRALVGTSIALVNSVGNLGGFVGPVILGALHDTKSAASLCAPAPSGCTAQWGGGVLALGAALALLTAATRVVPGLAAAPRLQK